MKIALNVELDPSDSAVQIWSLYVIEDKDDDIIQLSKDVSKKSVIYQ